MGGMSCTTAVNACGGAKGVVGDESCMAGKTVFVYKQLQMWPTGVAALLLLLMIVQLPKDPLVPGAAAALLKVLALLL